ncbi:MAG: hypothetical protein ABI678_31340, partial [Kofleriaceae bacterium]
FFVVTGADGTFVLDALAPGAYLVSPMVGGGGSKPKDIYIVRADLALGTRGHVEVDATPGPATVTVTAKTDDGKPVAMGGLFLIEAKVDVHNAAELMAPDQLNAIFGPKPITIHMRGVMAGNGEVEGVKVGDATLCVSPFAGRPPEDPSKALLKCQPVKVTAGKQTVAITVPAPK